MADQFSPAGQPVVFLNQVVKQNDPRLTDARHPLPHTHSLDEIFSDPSKTTILDYGTLD